MFVSLGFFSSIPKNLSAGWINAWLTCGAKIAKPSTEPIVLPSSIAPFMCEYVTPIELPKKERKNKKLKAELISNRSVECLVKINL